MGHPDAPQRAVVGGPRINARRTRVLATGAVVAAVAGIVGLLPAGGWGSDLAQASSFPTSESKAQLVEVVRTGDSLWAIAQRSMPGGDTRANISRIADLNHISAGALQVGQILLIPNG